MLRKCFVSCFLIVADLFACFVEVGLAFVRRSLKLLFGIDLTNPIAFLCVCSIHLSLQLLDCQGRQDFGILRFECCLHAFGLRRPMVPRQ